MRFTKSIISVMLLLTVGVLAIAQRGVVHQGARIQIEPSGSVTLQPKSGQAIDLKGDTTINAGKTVAYSATNYAGTGSFQPVGVDLNLAAAAGGTSGKFLSPVMGNIFGVNLSKSGNYVSGLIGALSVTGTRATELQVAAVTGIVMDGSTGADGAVVAVIDGSDPSAVTRANAAFAARMNNNNAGSGVDFGLDLYDAGRSSGLYSGGGLALPVAKCDIRLTREACIKVNAGAPTNGTSGTCAAVCGPGSLLIDVTNAKLYVNTNTKASPTWTVAGAQS